jgi:hypothetical protein
MYQRVLRTKTISKRTNLFDSHSVSGHGEWHSVPRLC